MHMYLRQWGAFWLVAGLATSSIALCTATPAAARRMPHGYQAGASAGDVAPRWDYGRTAWQEGEARDQPRRSASRRRAARVQRISQSSRRHNRSGQVQRLEPGWQATGANRVAPARFGNRRPADQASLALAGPQGGYDQRYVADRRASSGGSGGGVVDEARRWLGTNPTSRRSLWCGAFMNFVLERTGHHGTGSDLARSFASAGQRVSGPQIGAIAVMARRGGGHVGVVSGGDGNGNPIIISGNHGRKVAESVYARGRVYAYVMP